ncbi:MAG: hypothetical protein ACK5QT_08990 [Oligoflexia bacterium]|jgi:hypothetical protein
MRLVYFFTAVVGLGLGVDLSTEAHAAESGKAPVVNPRVLYPKKTQLDFEGIGIEGEIRNPGELYFQRRPEEKFDSLVKARRNFHPEIMRDIIQTR